MDRENKGIHYIVGARLGNVPRDMVQRIDRALAREDGRTIRLRTGRGHLVCSNSATRYRKDKYEMDKQLQRAETLLREPGKIRRVKFLRTDNKEPTLNRELIERTRLLLGIKGYYTDLNEGVASNGTIIDSCNTYCPNLNLQYYFENSNF